jgi:protein-tyrosine phosphatase-like protein
MRIEFRGILGEETIETLLLDSYTELASRATITRWLVIGAVRFARQRIQALAHAQATASGKVPPSCSCRTQCRAVTDGAWLVHPPRERPGNRVVGPLRTSLRHQSRRDRR